MQRKMIHKAVFSLLLALMLACSGCSASAQSPEAAVPTASPSPNGFQRFNRTDMDAFDTVITLVGFAQDQAAFDRAADRAFDKLHSLDHIFDGYNAYDGLHNLYYVNQHAAQEPI